ncbi:MAG: methyl-accepting chemotaxis protein, partial [Pseudomonadota bacterium]|nr:methyl-accepting chemotaxis protein [Pseudomonadota bacterium]
ANIQTVAGAAEEMLASVKEIAQNMMRSQTSISGIVAQNEEANHLVSELQNNTKSMEDIVALIRDISEQVNLLALNATIEAARAGDAGKGFAVVAGEVKSLANQTAAATDRISNEINNIQTIVSKVVISSEAISGGTASVGESIDTIAAAIEEQEAVTGEISQKMQVIAQGVQDLDEIIQKVSGS